MTSERAGRHYVVAADELDDGERVVVDVQEREVCVFNVDGEFHAVSNFCIHQGGPACEGDVVGVVTQDDDGGLQYERDGEFVCCDWHGWKFDVKTGRNAAMPEEYRLPTYEVVVDDGDVFVEL